MIVSLRGLITSWGVAPPPAASDDPCSRKLARALIDAYIANGGEEGLWSLASPSAATLSLKETSRIRALGDPDRPPAAPAA
jgi:hypothetical protein